MNVKRIVSVALILTFLIVFFAPAAYASNGVDLDNVTVGENYAIYNFENENMTYCLLIDTTTYVGQFSLFYSEDPDLAYEFQFSVTSSFNSSSVADWNNIINICFDNSTNWIVVDISKAVRVVSAETSTYAVDANLEKFIDKLVELNGEEYIDLELRKAYYPDNLILTQYQMMLHYARKDVMYYVESSISVVTFIVSVLKLIVTPSRKAALEAIASLGSSFDTGDIVTQYEIWTDWSRYVRINDGTYPYGMVEKVDKYVGYYSRDTGLISVDWESQEIIYMPEMLIYLGFSNHFKYAYEEYLQIGWQG